MAHATASLSIDPGDCRRLEAQLGSHMAVTALFLLASIAPAYTRKQTKSS
ncbi:hypothetical protein ACSFA8_23470 [Variovorax sp. RT4R15]